MPQCRGSCFADPHAPDSMLDPAIPPDETQRLEDLCRLELLDTAPEAERQP